MKKYFKGFVPKQNLSRLLSKFIVLFLIIPSLTLPQLTWAATGDLDKGIANPMRAVSESVYGPTAEPSDETIEQPSCLQRWSLRISRWWSGTPQTPFTAPSSPSSIELSVMEGIGIKPSATPGDKKTLTHKTIIFEEESKAPNSAVHLTDLRSKLSRTGAEDTAIDTRVSYSARLLNGTIVNPLMSEARIAQARNKAIVRNSLASPNDTNALRAAADEHIIEDDGSSTSTGGSDSPPSLHIMQNPIHVGAAGTRLFTMAGMPKDGEEDSTAVSISNSTNEDKPLTPEETSALKKWNTYIKVQFNHQTTRKNYAQYAATFVLTGLLATELWGEGKMISERTITSMMLSSKYFLDFFTFQDTGIALKKHIADFVYANAAIALVPYLPFRISKAISLLTPEQEKAAIQKPVPKYAAWLGQILTVLMSAANGAMPAYVSYQTNYLFSQNNVYTNTVPPFIFAFYTIDTFVRMEALKEKLFNKLFVSRGSAVSKEREDLVKRLREAKRAIFTMNAKELLAFNDKMIKLSQGSSELSALDTGKEQFKLLMSLKASKSAIVSEVASPPKKRSWTFMARKYGPPAAAAILAIGGAYLAWRLGYENFGQTYQYLDTGEPSRSVYDRMTLNTAQAYADNTVAQYAKQKDLWESATTDITLFNGNFTDWCWSCFAPDAYTLGSLEDPTSVKTTFLHCLGIKEGSVYAANINNGELNYDQYNCEGWFDWWQELFNEYDTTSVTYFNDYINVYAPYLSSSLNVTSEYQLSAGGKAFSGIGGGFSALSTYALGALATTGFAKRWINSFRHHPDEVMPGKNNGWFSGIEMSYALLQSIFRASPVLINGWLLMQDDNLPAGWMWITLSLATLTSAATYFPDFDETYSRLPGIALNFWGWTKNVAGRLIGRSFNKSDHILAKRDRLIIGIDNTIRMLLKADDKVISGLSNI